MSERIKISIAVLAGFTLGWLVCAGALLIYLSVSAGERPLGAVMARPHPGGAMYECTGVRVKDADTVEVDQIALPWGISLTNQAVRAASYDAYESGYHARSTGPAVTPEEIIKGKQAAKDFRELLAQGTLYIQPISRPRDDFGRLLANLFIDQHGTQIDLAEWMRSHGHVRPR